MNEVRIKTITIDGEDLVALSRADYDALLARAGDPAGEDVLTRRILAETGAAIARGEDVALPSEVWGAIEAGGNPVAVIRQFRGLTQERLCGAVGVSQGHLSDIESGRRTGSTDTLKALARALHVPLDILVGE